MVVLCTSPTTTVDDPAFQVANWWAPESLQRFYARHGFRQADDAPLPAPVPASAGAPVG